MSINEVNANGSIEFNLYCFFKQFIYGFLSTICANFHQENHWPNVKWSEQNTYYIYVCVYIKDGHKVLKKEQSLNGNLGKTKRKRKLLEL